MGLAICCLKGKEERMDKIYEYGIQPLDAIMNASKLSNHDLVAASEDQISHKMVKKGREGRRLSRNVQLKILKTLNAAQKQEFTFKEVFNYNGK